MRVKEKGIERESQRGEGRVLALYIHAVRQCFTVGSESLFVKVFVIIFLIHDPYTSFLQVTLYVSRFVKAAEN